MPLFPRSRPSGRWRLRPGLLFLFVLAVRPAHAADDSSEITAVFATVANGYTRELRPDGSPQPETFAFGEGGFTGIPLGDASVDGKAFRAIAHTIAPVLARAGYVSSQDPAQTKLLIMVYWGTTGTDDRSTGGYAIGAAAVPPPPPPPPVVVTGSGGAVVVSASPPPVQPPSTSEEYAFDAIASFQNRQRDRDNLHNAQVLGYTGELGQAATRPQSQRYLDLVEEVEDTRYFVVLRAYDFQLMWKQKERKALWETRYSIRARDHQFGDALVAMTDLAARYFGRESKGLVRREVPVGRVELGDLIFKGEVAPGDAQQTPQSP